MSISSDSREPLLQFCDIREPRRPRGKDEGQGQIGFGFEVSSMTRSIVEKNIHALIQMLDFEFD